MIPTGDLVAGATLTAPDIYGYAELTDMGGNHFKTVPLTEGTIEVRSGEVGPDICAEDEGWAQGMGPAFDLSWDLVWTGGIDETNPYTASGSDTVWFDTSLVEACRGW